MPSIPSNTDFKIFFQYIPTPCIVVAADAPRFTIVAANDAYLAATYKTAEGLIGRPIFEAFPDNPDAHADGSGNIRASFQEVIRTGLPHSLPYQQYDIPDAADGPFQTHFWNLTSSPVLSEDTGNVSHIMHVVTDVTAQVVNERRAAESGRLLNEREEALGVMERARVTSEASATYLQDVIDYAQTGIFVFTPVYDHDGSVADFRFLLANRMLAAYVGQTSSAITGGLGSAWFPDYKTNGLFDHYHHTWSTGEQQHFEFHYDGSGIDVWLDIMSTKLDDGDILVTFSDHTPLKSLQLKLESSVEELSRSNQYLEQFAYVASHDMQEPLRKIRAFGGMLAERHSVELGPQGRDLLVRMNAAARRMQALIEDLLVYSRVSLRPHELVEVATSSILKQAISDLEATIHEKGAEIIWEGMESVLGDPVQLGQLFQNMLSNAIKFSKPDVAPVIRITGTIVIGRDAGYPPASEESRRNYLRITFADNGIGFEQQYAERIFQMFQRLHGRSAIPGTGLGLSIVQKVVSNHNGRITATGTPGEGAVFHIYLPMAR